MLQFGVWLQLWRPFFITICHHLPIGEDYKHDSLWSLSPIYTSCCNTLLGQGSSMPLQDKNNNGKKIPNLSWILVTRTNTLFAYIAFLSEPTKKPTSKVIPSGLRFPTYHTYNSHCSPYLISLAVPRPTQKILDTMKKYNTGLCH